MAWDYTQTGDPGAVGVGRTWLHPTTGVLKVRNTANTAWTTIGNVDDPNFGSLLTSGGAVSANITGNTGWAASDAHNFPTTASINSVAIATINDVTSRISALESSIVPLISSAIATYSSSLTFANKIKVVSGEINQPAWNSVITIPWAAVTYGDGATALQDECNWLVTRLGSGGPPVGSTLWVSTASYPYFKFRNATDTADVNPNEVDTFISYVDTGNGRKYPVSIEYLIIALRP